MTDIPIPDTAEFTIDAESLVIKTESNGDYITIRTNLNREMAATLAWLANHSGQLNVEIKEVT